MMRKVISTRRPFTRAFLPLLLTLSLLMGLYSSAFTTGVSSAAESAPSANTLDKLTNQGFDDVNKQQLGLGPTAADQANASRLAGLSGPALPHQTDCLSAGCATHTFAGLNPSARATCLHNIKSRGYTTSISMLTTRRTTAAPDSTTITTLRPSAATFRKSSARGWPP
jgi:hypothetical protein